MQFFVFGLIKGRHELPKAVEGYIFTTPIEDVTDVRGLEQIARDSMAFYAVWRGVEDSLAIYVGGEFDSLQFDIPLYSDVTIYVTGLTVALIAALNVLRERKASVTLMHYDSTTGGYYSQQVI
jgi:hypothetical protein